MRVFALDPKWLLTGEYDAGVHRRALELTEANPHIAESTVREWVREQYRRLACWIGAVVASDSMRRFLDERGVERTTYEAVRQARLRARHRRCTAAHICERMAGVRVRVGEASPRALPSELERAARRDPSFPSWRRDFSASERRGECTAL